MLLKLFLTALLALSLAATVTTVAAAPGALTSCQTSEVLQYSGVYNQPFCCSVYLPPPVPNRPGGLGVICEAHVGECRPGTTPKGTLPFLPLSAWFKSKDGGLDATPASGGSRTMLLVQNVLDCCDETMHYLNENEDIALACPLGRMASAQ
ncbi:hypothetical protein BKA70DRAFT_1400288, partial [Coprinopsis sp. MPI-PUGE-AT-0042]